MNDGTLLHFYRSNKIQISDLIQTYSFEGIRNLVQFVCSKLEEFQMNIEIKNIRISLTENNEMSHYKGVWHCSMKSSESSALQEIHFLR